MLTDYYGLPNQVEHKYPIKLSTYLFTEKRQKQFLKEALKFNFSLLMSD